MSSKACKTCGQVKPVDEFATNGVRPRGHCKPCYKQVQAILSHRHYVQTREERCVKASAHRRNNLAAYAAHSAAYKARKIQQAIKLTPEQQAEIRRMYQTAAKLTAQTGVAHHVDHIHPLKHPLLCGLHVPWNMQVIPGKLNIKKSNSITIDTIYPKRIWCSHVDEA